MADKAWKRFERQVAAVFDTHRIPVLGREGADILGRGLSIDAKLRKEVPKTWLDAVKAAEMLGYNGISLAEEGVFAMRIGALFEDPSLVCTAVALPRGPLEWLSHMREHAAPRTYGCVAMKKPQRPFSETVIVIERGDFLSWKKELS